MISIKVYRSIFLDLLKLNLFFMINNFFVHLSGLFSRKILYFKNY